MNDLNWDAFFSADVEETIEERSWFDLPTSKDPMSDAMEVQLLRLGISGRVRRALLNGARPGHGEWVGAVSHQEIVQTVLDALKRVGVSSDDIKRIFEVSPLWGALEGPDTLNELIQHADHQLSRDLHDGENFEIVDITQAHESGRSVWRLSIRPGPEEGAFDGEVRMEARELFSERAFRHAIASSLGFLPVLRPEQRGKGFPSWARRLVRDARRIAPAEERVGDAVAERIMGELLNRGEMSRRAIRDLFCRHMSKGRIEEARQILICGQRIRLVKTPTPGRYAEVWKLA